MVLPVVAVVARAVGWWIVRTIVIQGLIHVGEEIQEDSQEFQHGFQQNTFQHQGGGVVYYVD